MLNHDDLATAPGTAVTVTADTVYVPTTRGTAAHKLVTEGDYTWVGATPPPPPEWDRSQHFDFLRALGLVWQSCTQTWDAASGRKKMSSRLGHNNREAAGIFALCKQSNVSVIDMWPRHQRAYISSLPTARSSPQRTRMTLREWSYGQGETGIIYFDY